MPSSHQLEVAAARLAHCAVATRLLPTPWIALGGRDTAHGGVVGYELRALAEHARRCAIDAAADLESLAHQCRARAAALRAAEAAMARASW